MIRFLKHLIRLIDRLNEWIGNKVSWLTTVLVLLICLDVFARYALNISYAAIFELEWHIFAIIFLLGSAYTLKHDRHVRVDVFYSQFPDHIKAWVNFLGSIFFLLPFCIIVIKGGIPYLETSIKLDEGSNDPGGLPARYIVKSMIIIGFALLLLQGISLLCSSFLEILGEKIPGKSNQTNP